MPDNNDYKDISDLSISEINQLFSDIIEFPPPYEGRIASQDRNFAFPSSDGFGCGGPK